MIYCVWFWEQKTCDEISELKSEKVEYMVHIAFCSVTFRSIWCWMVRINEKTTTQCSIKRKTLENGKRNEQQVERASHFLQGIWKECAVWHIVVHSSTLYVRLCLSCGINVLPKGHKPTHELCIMKWFCDLWRQNCVASTDKIKNCRLQNR